MANRSRKRRDGSALDREARLRDGVLGRFWLLPYLPRVQGRLSEDDSVAGQLQLVEGVVHIRTQEPVLTTLEDLHRVFTSFAEGAEPAPDWIFGITEVGSIVMPIVTGHHHRREFGGTKISVRSFRGPALAMSVTEPFGPRATLLSVRLPHAEWADLDPMSKILRYDEDHKWQGLDIALRSTGPLSCGKVGAIEISLSGSWNHADSEPDARTSVTTGVAITTISSRPRDVRDHVETAMAVQDLISLAYDDFLPSYSSQVALESGSGEQVRSWFHHNELLQSPFLGRDWSVGEEERRPLFTLEQLGGPSAISRWVRLNRDFPDAANAIRVRFRAPTNPTRRMIELGAAIEQYVASCLGQARSRGASAKWTRERPHSFALAARVDSFGDFVGNSRVWAERFHEAYINEKHHAGSRQPAADVVALSSSAQLLLIVTLLNRAARSSHPGEMILNDSRITPLGNRIRKLLET